MRGITKSVYAKFTQFFSKTTHISGCKNVYIYTLATVTVHICTVIVAVYINNLFFFSLSTFKFSLSFPTATANQQRRRK